MSGPMEDSTVEGTRKGAALPLLLKFFSLVTAIPSFIQSADQMFAK